jgi:hypothetical protein
MGIAGLKPRHHLHGYSSGNAMCATLA